MNARVIKPGDIIPQDESGYIDCRASKYSILRELIDCCIEELDKEIKDGKKRGEDVYHLETKLRRIKTQLRKYVVEQDIDIFATPIKTEGYSLQEYYRECAVKYYRELEKKLKQAHVDPELTEKLDDLDKLFDIYPKRKR